MSSAHSPEPDARTHDGADSASEGPRTKRELRREVLAARRATFVGPAQAASARAINTHLKNEILPMLSDLGRPAIIAGFSPLQAEASPTTFLRACAAAGHTIILPTYNGDELGWREWDGTTALQPSPGAKFGPEPTGPDHGPKALEAADLIITPAVAVDRSGTRLGHGKGYYDKALAGVDRDRTRIVTLIHGSELLPHGAVPREEHDIPILEVVTEDGLLRLPA